VLRSNIAATYLKLEDWKSAVDSATMAIDRLDKIIPPTTEKKDQSDSTEQPPSGSNTQNDDAVIELTGEDDEAEEKELKRLKEQDEQRNNVLRIRAKALIRRAKAKSQIGGWASLQGAAEDYQTLAAMENLPAADQRIVQRALLELPDRIKEAREKEMAEMMSKLKGVSGLPGSLLFITTNRRPVGQWYFETIRSIDGQLQVCPRSQDWRLLDELPVLKIFLQPQERYCIESGHSIMIFKHIQVLSA